MGFPMILFFLLPTALAFEDIGHNYPWDVDGPCQDYVETFAIAQANMVQCATNYSIPPRVCTYCINEYIAFKQVEYEMKHLDNVRSVDGRTCTQVIYNNYLISYGYEISEALSTRIWSQSRCDSCLDIRWNFTSNSTLFYVLNQTVQFEKLLFEWRTCVVDYFADKSQNISICTSCDDQFNQLFKYYWNIYTEPGIEFCVDVETTMNDTFHIWNVVWHCAGPNGHHSEVFLVILGSCLMGLFLSLFYVSSFIQGGGSRPHLVRYSRMDRPIHERSLLMPMNSESVEYPTNSLENNVALLP